MKQKQLSDAQRLFIEHVRELEERLFAEHLDATDANRMKSQRRSWHYRPSHHIASGLLTQEDIASLSQPGKRLLSIGAFPGFLEELLCKLGIPPENILLADNDATIPHSAGSLEKVLFDMTETWPDIGTFDRIIFPECLCIALADKIAQEKPAPDSAFATDTREAELLAAILKQAFDRLRPQGKATANGPMSHPNVIRAMSKRLDEAGYMHVVDYQRYLISLRPSKTRSSLHF